MHEIGRGLVEAFRLIVGGDASIYQIVLRSLLVSGVALVFALIIGVPLGATIALSRFPGRRLAVALLNTGMGVPPVVVGLIVFLLLARSGPVGMFHLLYTVKAMIIAQVLIALPIVAGLSLAALQQIDPGYRLQLLSLGASKSQLFLLLLREVRVPLMAAVMAAFGGVISEVGAVMMVGGNITGQTQVLTTGIVQETRMGDFASAIALGVILMVLAFATNYAMTIIQQRGKRAA
jgi:tungstate transport system permease protein